MIVVVVIVIVIVIAIVSVITIVVVAYQEDHATCVGGIHPVVESAVPDTPFLAPETHKVNFPGNMILLEIKFP